MPGAKIMAMRVEPDNTAGDYEVNDYMDKLNVESKRKQELKENVKVVKELNSDWEKVAQKIERLGNQIQERPNLLLKLIKTELGERYQNGNFVAPPVTKSPTQSHRPDHEHEDKDSDSSG
jgi:hypothetical protein